uniref:F-box domain-containing protein n=1 Tax=Mycena chlorophos TaxID=658473 RepID=A0ABQ0LMR7_MYCCL|nr:predicted protein [Mycena chlorophos]
MDSPFQTILNTNTVPSDFECDEIRALLRVHRPRLVHLNDEVARIRVMLDEAVRARNELQASIEAHEALISPMRRVSEDVLSVIFLHTLPTTRETALILDEGPLLLMQVCRYWRALTLAIPRLWASMHIVLLPKNSATALQLVGLKSEVEQWTKRAAAVPLSIRIYPSRKRHSILAAIASGDSPPDPASIVMDSLIPLVHQWRTIHLKVDDVRDLSDLDQIPPGAATHLKSFSITLSKTALGATEYRLPMLAAPALRQFAYQGRDNCIPATPLWRNLVRLTLSLSSTRGAPETDRQILPFPFLAECTALQTLHLSFTRMTFHYGKTPDRFTIREMLAPMTGLIHLRLVAPTAFLPEVAQNFLACLTPIANDEDPHGVLPVTVLCPNLEVLELAGSSSLSDECIIQFLRARAAHPDTMPVRQLKAVLARAPNGDLEAKVADLVRNGLELALIYRSAQAARPPRCSPLEGTERDPKAVTVKEGEDWLQEADPMMLD